MFKFSKPREVLIKKVRVFDFLEKKGSCIEEDVNEFFEDNPVIIKDHKPIYIAPAIESESEDGYKTFSDPKLLKIYEYFEREKK